MEDFFKECISNFQTKNTKTTHTSTLSLNLEKKITESSPPFYFELGKQVRDLFNVGYNFGLLSLSVITKSPKVKFTTSCVENLNQGNLFGSVEAKYEISDSFLLVEKWNTDCTVTLELCCKNKPIKGFVFTCSIHPRTEEKVGQIKTEWANKFLALHTQLDFGSKFALLTSSAVFGYRGLLSGILAKFDTYKAKLSDLNVAAGLFTEDFILHTTFNNGVDCSGSILHKVTPNIDAGVDVVYSKNKKSDILFGVAGRYQLDESICIRGKINNSNQLGLGYEQKLRECIVLGLSVLFDIRNFAEGKHKLGFALQFES